MGGRKLSLIQNDDVTLPFGTAGQATTNGSQSFFYQSWALKPKRVVVAQRHGLSFWCGKKFK